MIGVAEYMYKNYDKFNCKLLTKEECYMLGLNHDIGYIEGKEEHEARGAMLFPDSTMSEFIGFHGYSPKEYMQITGKTKIPEELLLLWSADLSVESSGEDAGKEVGYEERLRNIADRLGEKANEYRIAKETIEFLIKEGM